MDAHRDADADTLIFAGLVNDLREITEWGFDRCFKGSTSAWLIKVTQIDALIREIHPEMATANAQKVLRDCISDAIRSMPDSRYVVTEPTYKWLAAQLFELGEIDASDPGGKHYSKLMTPARDAFHASPATMRRRAATMYDLLAKSLVRLRDERRRVHAARGVESRLPGVISRPLLAGNILDAIEDGQRLVLLHGDAGTGKSTLAAEIMNQVAVPLPI